MMQISLRDLRSSFHSAPSRWEASLRGEKITFVNQRPKSIRC